MRGVELQPDAFSYNAGISACEKGKQWQRAVALLSEMCEADLDPDVIFSYSAGLRACEKGEQWQRALALLGEMRGASLQPDAFSYDAGIGACGVGGQWQRAWVLLCEMREAALELSVITPTALGSAPARRARSGSGLWRCSARCARRTWSPT
ncbi:unnamed protein product [Prorocentrum cordatum]|uniref:Uncharacterized protein n=1 Tax=Prorocentrum cordatum TaxID=2364126 RepID=A0ABN9UMJ4_9DINO|nr:unnamed protein product [Polarella glacialis]